MDPIFTLPWPEYFVAQKLTRVLKKSEGYSLHVPFSRQEEGIDLAVLRKIAKQRIQLATVQVKSSRIYIPDRPKRSNTKKFLYYTWFNRFNVSEFADYYILTAMYVEVPELGKVRQPSKGNRTYKDCTLLFTRDGMSNFLADCKQVSGKSDSKFAFGFDDPQQIFQTRGRQDRRSVEFTAHLLDRQLPKLKSAFCR